MGYGSPDPYYQPEAFGLTQIGLLDDPNACWSFNYLAVWQHEDGRVFWAQDSGCSCPSPFEDYNSLDDLDEVTDDTWDVFQVAVEQHCLTYEIESWHWDYDAENPANNIPRDTQGAERSHILRKVMAILRENRD